MATTTQGPAGHEAETPVQIPARGWWQVTRRAFKESSDDNVSILAGGVAFFAFLAIFPAIIAAITLYGLIADPGQVGADFIGIPAASGILPPDKKPQVAGVFTDLEVTGQPGLSARIDIDTRFITSPTPLKLAVMVLGVACVIASIVALAVLDRLSGRRVPGPWRRFWRVEVSTWLADIVVIGILLLWHLIGATTSDDGYNLTIARVSDEAGYNANYFRFFGASEAPFDWYQSVLAQFASISTAGVWMRLPATFAGIATWLILSRASRGISSVTRTPGVAVAIGLYGPRTSAGCPSPRW